MILNIFVSVGVIGLFSINAQAAIYKCVNTKSKVYYIDKPCPKKDEETEFKAVKDPQNGYKPPAFEEDKVEKAKEGIVVGGDSSKKLSTTLDDNGSKKSTNSAEGGDNNKPSGSSSASGVDNDISKSISSNDSSKVESSTISSLGEPKYDGREPANVDDLIPATEAEAKALIKSQ